MYIIATEIPSKYKGSLDLFVIGGFLQLLAESKVTGLMQAVARI